jgi:hypothetical protein
MAFDRAYKKFAARSGANVSGATDIGGHGWQWADTTTTLGTASGVPAVFPGGPSDAKVSMFVVAKFATIAASTFPTLLTIDDGTTNNYLYMIGRHTTNALRVQVVGVGAGTSQWGLDGAIIPGTIQTFGLSWNLSDFGNLNPTPLMCVDGKSIAVTQVSSPTAVSWTAPASVRRVWIGSRATAGESMQGIIYAAFKWDRLLKADDFRWLDKNWFRMFAGIRGRR